MDLRLLIFEDEETRELSITVNSEDRIGDLLRQVSSHLNPKLETCWVIRLQRGLDQPVVKGYFHCWHTGRKAVIREDEENSLVLGICEPNDTITCQLYSYIDVVVKDESGRPVGYETGRWVEKYPEEPGLLSKIRRELGLKGLESKL